MWQKLPKAERRKAERQGGGFHAALARVCKVCGAKMGPGMGITPTEDCITRVARQVHET